MGPRVEALDRDRARGAAAGVGIAAEMADLNVFRVLLQHPQLLPKSAA